jgi:hypothetical protein
MYYIKYLDMFRAILGSTSGGRNCIFTASGIVTLCERPCTALHGRLNLSSQKHEKLKGKLKFTKMEVSFEIISIFYVQEICFYTDLTFYYAASISVRPCIVLLMCN